MATITKDKLQEILKNKPLGASDEAIIKSIIGRGHTIEGLELPSQKIEQEKLQPNRGQRIENVINESGQTVRQNILGEGEFEGQTPLRRGAQATAAAFSAVPKTAIAAAPEPVRHVAGQLGDFASKGFNRLVNFIGDNKQLQKFVMDNPDTAKAIEEVAGTLQATGEIAGTILGVRELARFGDKTAKLTDDAFKSTFTKNEQGIDVPTAQTVKVAVDQAPEPVRQKAVQDLAATYQDSLLSTKTARKKIEEMAREKNVTSEELLQEFVDRRGLPGRVLDDGTVSFDPAIRDFTARQDSIGKSIQDYLDTRVELTTLDSLRSAAKAEFSAGGKATEFASTNKRIDKIFNELEAKYGNDITPAELNQIRIEANQKWKDNDYEVDAFRAVGNASRGRIDEIIGDERVRRLNQEWGALEDQIRIARQLDGQKVDVGLLQSTLGSYIAATAIGTAGLATGSGSLVVAGLASTFGAKTLANWIRRRKINDPGVQEVLKAVRQDERLVQELIEATDEANKAQMERLLLPAPGQTSVIQLPSAELGRGPGSRVISTNNQPQ